MDLNQLVTKVHALTSMVLRLKVKVHKLESAAELRKGRSERRPSRAKTGLSIPSFTFQMDKRLPYRFWAHVCMEFGKACKTARDFARWLVVDWISQYKLLNRKKVLSVTSGRLRYFYGGAQVSISETDMFGRGLRGGIGTTKRFKMEVGERKWWDFGSGHFRHIGQIFRNLPGYEDLTPNFKRRIAVCWAPYSMVKLYGATEEYDPLESRLQKPQVLSLIEHMFSGFRAGIQNQSNHSEWVAAHKLAPIIERAKKLSTT
jgi:hypothetical protein